MSINSTVSHALMHARTHARAGTPTRQQKSVEGEYGQAKLLPLSLLFVGIACTGCGSCRLWTAPLMPSPPARPSMVLAPPLALKAAQTSAFASRHAPPPGGAAASAPASASCAGGNASSSPSPRSLRRCASHCSAVCWHRLQVRWVTLRSCRAGRRTRKG